MSVSVWDIWCVLSSVEEKRWLAMEMSSVMALLRRLSVVWEVVSSVSAVPLRALPASLRSFSSTFLAKPLDFGKFFLFD